MLDGAFFVGGGVCLGASRVGAAVDGAEVVVGGALVVVGAWLGLGVVVVGLAVVGTALGVGGAVTGLGVGAAVGRGVATEGFSGSDFPPD